MLPKLFYIVFFSAIIVSCKGPDARMPIQSHSGTFIKESANRNKEIYDQEKKYIETLIANDSTKAYFSSENGFWYFYNKRDTTQSQKPQIGDLVKFTYNIKDLKGSTILTEEENGIQYYKVDQSNQDLVSGIREGIKLMKIGETVTFLLPSYKAYGYYGIEDKLGTNIPVQSTVTLQSIEHPNKE